MVNQSNRKSALQFFLVGMSILVALNVLSSAYYLRLDLTEDKRYTIQEATKKLLSSLDERIYVDVYLEGDLNSGFKRLSRSTRETLEEFQVYAGRNIQYNFINPDAITDASAKRELIEKLSDLGIQPTNIFETVKGKRTEKLIFPGAIVSFKGKERGVMLLKGNRSAGSQEVLNQSVENIEFELATAIQELSGINRNTIGWMVGHAELDSVDVAAAKAALSQRHDIKRVNATPADLEGVDALIIAQPKYRFSEAEKYAIDQFVMSGRPLLLTLSQLHIRMDSAGAPEGTIALPYEHDLDDLLFKYGVRLNKDLIMDLNSGAHPVFVGSMGNQPQIRLLPWPFYPIVNNFGTHPTTRNLDNVYLRFAGTIDSVRADGIRKTPLFFSSRYSQRRTAPVNVSFNEMRREPDPQEYNKANIPLAYLLEGEFESLYKNRFLPDGFSKADHKEQSIPNRIFVVSDGDFLRNELDFEKGGRPHDLGFEPYTKRNFANKDFFLNMMTYLLEEDGLILARNKEIALRPLDQFQTRDRRTFWQMINLALPLAVLLLMGLVLYFLRKRKYTRYY
ncbi:MAG: gliding motility-associated ABC transporter substrate-binding protein GldG [Cyclobacteriaceae bacterium]|nr:gliding motility-associated ABC transporter substrate-binding protein GldG [Cyclobacteriaceae bacterium]MCH8515731.1 gliding motility-associated ABC transporter substrate-binding protein GldG [Cyclobacteriaceae bacterium]